MNTSHHFWTLSRFEREATNESTQSHEIWWKYRQGKEKQYKREERSKRIEDEKKRKIVSSQNCWSLWQDQIRGVTGCQLCLKSLKESVLLLREKNKLGERIKGCQEGEKNNYLLIRIMIEVDRWMDVDYSRLLQYLCRLLQEWWFITLDFRRHIK